MCDPFYPAHLQTDFTACCLLDAARPCASSVVITTNTSNTVCDTISLSTSILVSLFNSHLVSPFSLTHTHIYTHTHTYIHTHTHIYTHTHTHTHTRWAFLHGQSQCCYRDAAHMMNRLWQHNFSIISLSRSSLYQHNSATFKWQLTVLLWWHATIRLVKNTLVVCIWIAWGNACF